MVPELIYGTAWKEERTAALVREALAAGFRAFDTANQRKHYHEAGVGEAIGAFLEKHDRNAIFLQTKFTYARGQDHRLPYDPEARPAVQVAQSFARSLEHLGVSTLDSYLLHGPETGGALTATDWEVWRTIEEHLERGLTRQIGVSNVSAAQLVQLCEGARHRPSFVQNRTYARRGWDAEVRTICREAGIHYQGFSLLTANRDVWNDRKLHPIARRLGATPAMVIFRYAIHLGILPMTGTSDPAHMRQDLLAPGLELAPDEIAILDRLGRDAAA